MADSDSTPPVKSSTVAKTGAITGILATIVLVWQTISPVLPTLGVPPKVVSTIQTVVQLAEDNKDRLQQLEDEFEAWKAQHKPPVVVTPPQVSPTPLPVVSPEIQALQDQLKALKDLLDNQNQPPPPIQIQPQPVTPPAPVLPSAIKAVDSSGKPISGTVDPGQQFFVSATATGGTWTIIKSADQDVDAKVYTDEVSCVLRNEAVLTVVHSSGQPITTSSLIIKCNKGAQPPPPVVNVDPVKPVPTPHPTPSGDLRVMLVYESGQNHTREQLNVLNSTKLLAAMTAKCVEEGGMPGWRRWDKDLKASKDPSPSMRALWDKVLPIAKEDGLPAMAVACGADVAVYPLPKTEAEAIALLACGGK